MIVIMQEEISDLVEAKLIKRVDKMKKYIHYDAWDTGVSAYVSEDPDIVFPKDATNWDKLVNLYLIDQSHRAKEFPITSVFHTEAEVKKIIKMMLQRGWKLEVHLYNLRVEAVILYANVVGGKCMAKEVCVPEGMEDVARDAKEIWEAQDAEWLEAHLFKEWVDYSALDPTHILAGVLEGVPPEERPEKPKLD